MVVCNTMENLLNRKPEMSGNGIAVEDVVFAGSQTDIVDNQGSVSDFAVGDDADVGAVAFKLPSHNVACLIIRILYRLALACEISHEVGYAAVVDVGIGLFQAPTVGIGGEVPAHILMDKFLQIHILVAQGADDDVGAYAFFHRYVTHRIFEFGIGRVITQGLADLVARRLDDFRGWSVGLGNGL